MKTFRTKAPSTKMRAQELQCTTNVKLKKRVSGRGSGCDVPQDDYFGTLL